MSNTGAFSDFATKRSTRSVPTGRGSRGGWFFTREYRQHWLQTSPAAQEYRLRDNARRARAKQLKREMREADVPALSDTVAYVVADLARKQGARPTARRLGLDHSLVVRVTNGNRRPGADTLDAVVAHLGIYRLVELHQSRVRRAKAGAPE